MATRGPKSPELLIDEMIETDIDYEEYEKQLDEQEDRANDYD